MHTAGLVGRLLGITIRTVSFANFLFAYISLNHHAIIYDN